jgi:hypothetical protein
MDNAMAVKTEPVTATVDVKVEEGINNKIKTEDIEVAEGLDSVTSLPTQ